MRKPLKIGLIAVAVISLFGVLIPTIFIRERAQFTAAAAECTNDKLGDREDARIAASQLFNPIEKLFILRTIVTGSESNALDISAYTLFGIEFVRVRFECKDGNIDRASVIKRVLGAHRNSQQVSESNWKLIKSIPIPLTPDASYTAELFESTEPQGESGVDSPMYGVRLVIKSGDNTVYTDSRPDFYMDDYLEAKDVTNDGIPEVLYHSGFLGASNSYTHENIIRYDPASRSFIPVAPNNFGTSNRVTDRWVTVAGLVFKVVADPLSPYDANDPHSCEGCPKFYEYYAYKWDPDVLAFVQITTATSTKDFEFGIDPLDQDLNLVISRISPGSGS